MTSALPARAAVQQGPRRKAARVHEGRKSLTGLSAARAKERSEASHSVANLHRPVRVSLILPDRSRAIGRWFITLRVIPILYISMSPSPLDHSYHEDWESSATMSDEVPKIDVSQWITELEQVLRSAKSPPRCEEALNILQRWQFDEMLDDASREKARTLIREFARISFRMQA
jgi:hypothetical protein